MLHPVDAASLPVAGEGFLAVAFLAGWLAPHRKAGGEPAGETILPRRSWLATPARRAFLVVIGGAVAAALCLPGLSGPGIATTVALAVLLVAGMAAARIGQNRARLETDDGKGGSSDGGKREDSLLPVSVSLPDRAALERFLAGSLAGQGDGPGEAAVLSIGLENLTPATDALGREAGEELVRGAAGRIRRGAFREVGGDGSLLDRKPGGIMLARGAGDELIAVIAGPADIRDLQHRARAITAALCEPLVVNGVTVRLGARVGIARAPADSCSAEELVRCAGTAMRAADSAGAARCVFFQPRHRDVVRTRLMAESGLRAAIARDDIHVFYQPKVDMRTGRLVGVEALMRMRDADGRMQGPGAFIDIAERTGLIVEVGAIILRKAARQCRMWSDAGLRIPVAVNASPVQFARPRFVRDILDTVAESGAAPALIEIELTESAATEDVEASRRRLRQLRQGGLRVAIDDFGTGYSNIAQFAQLEFDTLKIDRSIIELIGKGHRGEAVLSGILGIAASIGHKVVAEGIETRQQLAFLRKHGCPVAQGFLFGKPMPVDELMRWIETQELPRSPFNNRTEPNRPGFAGDTNY